MPWKTRGAESIKAAAVALTHSVKRHGWSVPLCAQPNACMPQTEKPEPLLRADGHACYSQGAPGEPARAKELKAAGREQEKGSPEPFTVTLLPRPPRSASRALDS